MISYIHLQSQSQENVNSKRALFIANMHFVVTFLQTVACFLRPFPLTLCNQTKFSCFFRLHNTIQNLRYSILIRRNMFCSSTE